MADGSDSVVLAVLRRIEECTDRMAGDLHDLKVRATSMEEGMAVVNRRLDRLESRVDRIERRLELTATH